jgi:hypothetical protein
LEEAVVKDRELSPYQKIVELEREVEEQARLNGMGSEREARLMAEVKELKLQVKVLKYVFEGALQILFENKITYNPKLIKEAAERAVKEQKEAQP